MTDLDELEKLLAAATQGPFTISVTEKNEVRVMAHDAEDPNNPWHFCTVEWDCNESSPLENAAAIVALHNAAPGLIADNRRMAERLAVLEAALRGVVDEEECYFDHHGYCQAHFITSPCEMMLARKALEASHDQ